MGGSAILVFGNVDMSLLESRPVKQSVFQKLLGIRKHASLKETRINDQLTIKEIQNHPLHGLRDDFKKYLLRTIPRPHSASKQIISYLNMKTMTIYLRADKSPQKTDWYVQFSFSGCAGLAETSAELCTHWIEIWLHEERDLIFDTFGKNGFQAGDQKDSPSGYCFIPFEKYGYGRILQKDEIYEGADYEGSQYLSFDQGSLESLADKELSGMKELDRRYQKYITENKCCCQICQPDFAPLKV